MICVRLYVNGKTQATFIRLGFGRYCKGIMYKLGMYFKLLRIPQTILDLQLTQKFVVILNIIYEKHFQMKGGIKKNQTKLTFAYNIHRKIENTAWQGNRQNVLAQKRGIRIPKSPGKAWLRNRIEIYKFFIAVLESFPILLAGNRIKWTLLPLSCTSLTQNGTLTFIRIPRVTGSTAMRWLLPRHRFNHRSVRVSS